MKNVKTSGAGIAAVLTGLSSLISIISSDNPDYNQAAASISSIIAGIGLLCAKDHNVTGGSIQQ